MCDKKRLAAAQLPVRVCQSHVQISFIRHILLVYGADADADADIYLTANADADVYADILFITSADADVDMKKICG